MPESEGTVTLGDMKAWPREDQKRHYKDLCFACLLNEADGHKETAEGQRRQLAAMRRLWDLSDAEAAALENRAATRIAQMRELFQELFKEPTKH